MDVRERDCVESIHKLIGHPYRNTRTNLGVRDDALKKAILHTFTSDEILEAVKTVYKELNERM